MSNTTHQYTILYLVHPSAQPTTLYNYNLDGIKWLSISVFVLFVQYIIISVVIHKWLVQLYLHILMQMKGTKIQITYLYDLITLKSQICI